MSVHFVTPALSGQNLDDQERCVIMEVVFCEGSNTAHNLGSYGMCTRSGTLGRGDKSRFAKFFAGRVEGLGNAVGREGKDLAGFEGDRLVREGSCRQQPED